MNHITRRSSRIFGAALACLLLASLLPTAGLAQTKPPQITSTTTPGKIQSSSPGRYRTQGQSSPGRYRTHGQYRGSERANQYYDGQQWQPSNYYQNKYHYLQQPLDFTAYPSVSPTVPVGRHVYGIAPVQPVPVQPVYVYEPYPSYQEPAPQQQPQPQIVIVQQPAPPPPPPVAPPPPPPPRTPPPPVATAPGNAVLSIQPADAEVYLNNISLGDSGRQGEKLLLDAGVYVLEVEHPDYRPQRLIFSPVEHETIYIRVDLTEDRPNRRASVDSSASGISIERP